MTRFFVVLITEIVTDKNNSNMIGVAFGVVYL